MRKSHSVKLTPQNHEETMGTRPLLGSTPSKRAWGNGANDLGAPSNNYGAFCIPSGDHLSLHPEKAGTSSKARGGLSCGHCFSVGGDGVRRGGLPEPVFMFNN